MAREIKKWIKENQLVVLAAIVILALFLRSWGFQAWHGESGDLGTFTWDEETYTNTAWLLSQDFWDYSAQSLYEKVYAPLEKQGYNVDPIKKLAKNPLFPHPPLFPYSISFFYRLFGAGHLSAFRAALLMGTMAIIFVYYIGRELYDLQVGLLAAFLLAIDPAHWNISQRIWLDGPLTALIYLGVLLFILGLRDKRYLLSSGMVFGLGLLTKYHAVIALAAVFVFSVAARRDLLKKREFWVLFLLAFAVFSPWVIWVQKAYGEPFTETPAVRNNLEKPIKFLQGIFQEEEPSPSGLNNKSSLDIDPSMKYSPKITGVTVDPPSHGTENTAITIKCNAFDGNSDPLEYRYYLLGPRTDYSLAPISAWTASDMFSWRTDSRDIGPNVLGCTVRDNDGIYEFPQYLFDDHKELEGYYIRKSPFTYLKEGFSWNHQPINGWQMGLFREQGWYFYLLKLIEYSPLFIFSYLSVVILYYEKRHGDLLLIILAAGFIAYRTFFSTHNYETRYILPAIPALLLLSARTQFWIWNRLEGKNYAKGAFLLLILYLIARGFKVAYYLSVTVNSAYF